MILWLLLTACFVFLVDADPHTAEQRKRLKERSAFYRAMTTCPACVFGWGAAWSEVFTRTGAFVPRWVVYSFPRPVVDGLSPVLAAAAGVGLGYLVMLLSPMMATVQGMKMAQEARRSQQNAPQA